MGDEVVEGVCAGVDGNPLFLEQRFSSLVETGALAKAGTAWRLSATDGAEVPDVLERLIRSRVDRLAPRQRQAIVAASVLGTEFTLSTLTALTDASEQSPIAVAELCASGLINEVRQVPEPVYRFRHALIQEATYRAMLRAQRRQLHARAAWGLEATSADRLDEVAAVLGHHYAAAGETGRAVHYLEVAGDHAVSVCANEEAISSYRVALAVVGPGHPSDEFLASAAVQMRFKLAYLLRWRSLGGEREAREVLAEAIGLVDERDSFQAARLQNLLGRMEIENHDYEAALSAYDAAVARLGDRPEDQDHAVVALWFEIQLEGRALVYFFSNEPAKGAAVLAEVSPVVEARGGPIQKQNFYTALLRNQLSQARHRVNEEIIATARAASKAADEVSDYYEPVLRPPWPAAGWKLFDLARCLVLHGDLDEAEEKLNAALAVADRVGEPLLHLRCLSHLALAALRRHDAARVAALVPQTLGAAEATSSPDYEAMAKACLAWLAWREGRSEEVEPRAAEALALWANDHWLAARPLDLPVAAHCSPARDWACRRSGPCQPQAFGALPTTPTRRARGDGGRSGSSLGQRQARACRREAGPGSGIGRTASLRLSPHGVVARRRSIGRPPCQITALARDLQSVKPASNVSFLPLPVRLRGV